MYLTSTCVGRVNSHCPLNECPPNTNKYITVFTSFAIFPDTDRKLKLWEVNWKCSQPGGRGWEWRSVRRHTSDSTRGQPASEAVVRPEVSARSSTKSSLGSEGGREGGRGARLRTVKACPTGQQWMTLWNYPVWLRWRTHATDVGTCLAPERDADLISTNCPMETCRSRCPSS